MEVVEACLLLDFYGQLLTERTRSILEQHFSEDMSFGEIAEREEISRQAVHDTVHRGLTSLTSYEDKLHLMERFVEQKERIRRAFDALEKNHIKEASEILSAILQDL